MKHLTLHPGGGCQFSQLPILPHCYMDVFSPAQNGFKNIKEKNKKHIHEEELLLILRSKGRKNSKINL